MHVYCRPGKRGNHWYCEFRHERQRYRPALKVQTRKQAELKAARIYARVRAGLPAEEEQQERQAPGVLECLSDFLALMEDRDLKPKTIKEVGRLVAGVLNDADIVRLDEATAPALELGLSYLADRKRTRNKAISKVKAFFAWLVKTGRLGASPAVALEAAPYRPERLRDALSEAELGRLTSSDLIHDARHLVYGIAACTGLRRAEISRVRWRDVDPEAGAITLPGSKTKNGKPARILLPCSLAAAWRAWLEDPIVQLGGDLAEWPDPLPAAPTLRTYYLDLERANIPRERPGGVLDFHSLRVTFGSRLARAGVGLQLAQKLMRHSDPRLTANVYTRFAAEDWREAIEKVDLTPGADCPAHKNAHNSEAFDGNRLVA